MLHGIPKGRLITLAVVLVVFVLVAYWRYA
jgi:hypothetical protein